jgi:hypothetical protein
MPVGCTTIALLVLKKKFSHYLGDRDAVAGRSEIQPDSHPLDAEVKKSGAPHNPYISTAQIRSAFLSYVQNSEAGELRRRKHKTLRTRRKFEIKKFLSSLRKRVINLQMPFEFHKMKAKTRYFSC